MRSQKFASRRVRRGWARGFTLVELMVVVAITGVLATIGVMLVQAHFRDAKMLEAVTIIQAIRVAQEERRAEGGSYIDCSITAGAPWYPATPDADQHAWRNPGHADWARWRQLGVNRPDGTRYGFLVRAGDPGTALPAPQTASKPAWPLAPELTSPWYVIQAAGDNDKDGTLNLLVAASFNGELYVENEGE